MYHRWSTPFVIVVFELYSQILSLNEPNIELTFFVIEIILMQLGGGWGW